MLVDRSGTELHVGQLVEIQDFRLPRLNYAPDVVALIGQQRHITEGDDYEGSVALKGLSGTWSAKNVKVVGGGLQQLVQRYKADNG